MVPEGKPRTRRVRGFSIIHASDSEAITDGRALVFAEDHVAEPKGKNPRPPYLRAAGGFAIERERVFSVDGSAPEAPSESEGIAFESGR